MTSCAPLRHRLGVFNATTALLCLLAANTAQAFTDADCQGLYNAWSIERTTVTSSTFVNTPVPHCHVKGTTGSVSALTQNPASTTGNSTQNIRFEMRLPMPGTDSTGKPYWNGRFFHAGGSGTDGFVASSMGSLFGQLPAGNTGLARGYAVIGSDSGHDALNRLWNISLTELYGAAFDFGLNPVKRMDYAYQALGEVTRVGKGLINLFHGTQPSKSFFVGCSNGGRQGFQAATRLANQYDAVLAVSPAINIGNQMLQAVTDAQQLAQLQTKLNVSGPGNALTSADMDIVGDAVLKSCDPIDGASDGIVADMEFCQMRFNPDTLTCPTGSTSNCLKADKVTALKAMMRGVIDRNGKQLYAPWAWEPNMRTNSGFASWRTWRIASAFTNQYPMMTVIGAGALGNIMAPLPTAGVPGNVTDSWNYLQSFDLNGPRMDDIQRPVLQSNGAVESSLQSANVPDPTHLTTFKNRNGKILVVTGTADPAISVMDVVNWYKGLKAADANAETYAQLYLVPGMNHCSGGATTDQFDAFNVLEKWVDGVTPDQQAATVKVVNYGSSALVPNTTGSPLIASVRSNSPDVPISFNSGRQRPLCKYPKVARHTGKTTPMGLFDYISANAYRCE